MKYNFDEIIDRKNNHSVKYNELARFGFDYLKYIFEEIGVEIVTLYEGKYENLTEKEKIGNNEKKEKRD